MPEALRLPNSDSRQLIFQGIIYRPGQRQLSLPLSCLSPTGAASSPVSIANPEVREAGLRERVLNQPRSGTGNGRSPSMARTTKDLGRDRDELCPDYITEGPQRARQERSQSRLKEGS